MGGRGRGRGKGMTFDPREMGFNVGEQLPGPVLQPPPTFPPLDHRPSAINTSPEMEYMVAVKKDLAIFLKDHMALDASHWDHSFDWRRIPLELRPGKVKHRSKKRPADTISTQAKKVTFDINQLDVLAKLDDNPDEDDGEKEGTEEKEEGEEEGNEEDEVEDDVDEEMDDGTDYVNNYFDNGEGFDDDDDNGNDGPIY